MHEDFSGIMVYAGDTARTARELLGRAHVLAEALSGLQDHRQPPVTAVLCGYRLEGIARDISRFADLVYLADAPHLALYHPGRYARILSGLAAQHRPEIMIFPASREGQELAATVAARLRTGLASHAAGLDIDGEGRLVQLVATYGDGVLGEILCPDHRPQMVTIPPGLFPPARPRSGSGEIVPVEVPDGQDDGVVPAAVEEKNGAAGRLEDAPLVLVGGCGLQNEANWRALGELGGLLSAPVGCTRPVLDAGWEQDENRMIGISGTVVGPAVYLGLGVSGSAHHTVGMERAAYVIAVNSDPNAPLLGLADLAVVGDAGAIIGEMLKILNGKERS